MRRVLSVLLVAVAAVLLFWRLDGCMLWRDEATTANWGRLMAESGVWLPRVFDGRQLIVQASDGHDFNSKLLPAMQSWGQFYVSAVGFKLLGVSDLTARLPFAVLGALSLFVLYRIGVLLFGTGLQPFLLPYLAVLSIYFLFAARQGRYYIMVVLAASLLLLEFCRYLRERRTAGERSFYVKVGLWGLLLYFANYVSFAGVWAALTVFVLTTRDWRLMRGFFLLTAGMGVFLGLEFWLLHAEFASRWPPPEPVSNWQLYRSALTGGGSNFWRAVPLGLLLPAAFYLFWRRVERPTNLMLLGTTTAAVVAWSPVLFSFDRADVDLASDPLFWAGALVSLTIPGTLFFCWQRVRQPGLWARAALLATLILVLSPLLTIAIGKNKAQFRHYTQTIPATILLGAVATAGVARSSSGRWGSALFLGLLIWPNLDFNVGSCDQVVERQFFRDHSYNEPLIGFLRARVRAGEKVAFFRNVKGMMAYFQMPQMHWVALLDSENPYNQKYRGILPDDQFDDYDGVDWYVVWDPRGESPRGLSGAYERVWECTFRYRQSFWDRQQPRERSYEVYRRRPAGSATPPSTMP